MRGYSIQKHHGNWVLRRSVYVKGKRTQPTFIIASVRNYPKKADVTPLAEAHMTRVQRSRTVQAGESVSKFIENVFFPDCKARLGKNTLALYQQNWRRLEPHIGKIRLRDVMTPHIQSALDAIHDERKEEISHASYLHLKVTASAIFSLAIRRGDHPGPNPENNTSVRKYGHTQHRANGAFDLNEIKQFLTLFSTGDIAVAIAINAFLALRKPEIEGLVPEDFDPKTNRVRIHTDTKTGNDEWLPTVAPLRKILAGGWNHVSLRRAEYAIVKGLEGTTLKWKGWYAFRRGMLTNLWKLGVPVEEAALILRNSPEVCRKHYLRLDTTVSKQSAMDMLEKAYTEHVVVQ
jgi:integrase